MPVTRKKIFLLFKRVTPVTGIEFRDSATDTHVLSDFSISSPPPSDEFANATHRLSIYEDWDLEVPVTGIEFQESVTDTHVLQDYGVEVPPPSDEFTNATHRLSVYEDWDLEVPIAGVEFQESVTDTHVLQDYGVESPPPSDEFGNATHRLSVYEDFAYIISIDVDIVIRGDDEQLDIAPSLGAPYTLVDGVKIWSGTPT